MNLNKNTFNIITALVALGAATAVNRFIDSRYARNTGELPPLNPEDENYNLAEVLIYTSATTLVASAVSVLVKDLVNRQWKNRGNELPDEIRSTLSGK